MYHSTKKLQFRFADDLQIKFKILIKGLLGKISLSNFVADCTKYRYTTQSRKKRFVMQ